MADKSLHLCFVLSFLSFGCGEGPFSFESPKSVQDGILSFALDGTPVDSSAGDVRVEHDSQYNLTCSVTEEESTIHALEDTTLLLMLGDKIIAVSDFSQKIVSYDFHPSDQHENTVAFTCMDVFGTYSKSLNVTISDISPPEPDIVTTPEEIIPVKTEKHTTPRVPTDILSFTVDGTPVESYKLIDWYEKHNVSCLLKEAESTHHYLEDLKSSLPEDTTLILMLGDKIISVGSISEGIVSYELNPVDQHEQRMHLTCSDTFGLFSTTLYMNIQKSPHPSNPSTNWQSVINLFIAVGGVVAVAVLVVITVMAMCHFSKPGRRRNHYARLQEEGTAQ